MSKVVLIHGIAQEQKSAPKLLDEWLPDLRGGLENAGFKQLSTAIANGRVSVNMAFYGDIFLEPGSMGAGDEDLPDEAATLLANRLAKEWLIRAETRSHDDGVCRDAVAARKELDAAGGLEEMGVASAVRSVTSALAKVRWFARPTFAVAEKLVWRALRQVSLYLSNTNGVRDRIQEIVTEVVGRETAVIVGHSLGSVVGYEACHRLNHNLPLLVTLGSPLGLDTIVYERLDPQPPTYPKQVHRWVNAADTDDLVAADPTLAVRFGESVEDIAVDNGAQPHSPAHYLSKPQVGRAIADALQVDES